MILSPLLALAERHRAAGHFIGDDLKPHIHFSYHKYIGPGIRKVSGVMAIVYFMRGEEALLSELIMRGEGGAQVERERFCLNHRVSLPQKVRRLTATLSTPEWKEWL